MKRFRTQPSEFYALDREVRLRIYHREIKMIMRENDEAEKVK